MGLEDWAPAEGRTATADSSLSAWAPTTPSTTPPTGLEAWSPATPAPKSSPGATVAPTEAPSTSLPVTGFEEYTPEGEIPGERTAKKLWALRDLPSTLTKGAYGLLRGEVAGAMEGKDIGEATFGPYAQKVAERPGVLGESAAEFVGPTFGEAYRQGSLAPLFMEEGKPSIGAVEETLRDLLLAPFTIGAVGQPVAAAAAIGAKAATKLPIVGKPLARAGEAVAKKVIPRWGFTDELTLADAMKQGDVFAKTLAAKETVASTETLPDYAKRFLEPKLGGMQGKEPSFFGQEGPAFTKALSNPAGLPINPLTGEATHFGRYADFAIDQQGNVRNLHPEQFAKLGLDEQQKILNFRAVVDSNSKAMLDRGIIRPEQYDPGYLRRAYAIDVTPTAWREKLADVTDPEGQRIMAAARAHLVKNKYSDPDAMINHLLEHGPEILARPGYPGPTSPYGSAATALIKRIQMSPPIRNLLGPLDPGTLQAGKALDYQIRILANDAFMERATTLAARDGGRFVIPAAATKGIPAPGYISLETNTQLFGRWGGSWIHPDMQDAIGVMRGNTFTGPFGQLIRYWKGAKVAFNPGTWLNNIAGDAFVFSTAAGASALNPANLPHYKDAAFMMKELFRDPAALTKYPELAAAIHNGAVIPGFASNEISRMYGILAEQPGFTGLQAWANAHARGLTTMALGDERAAALGRVGKTVTETGEAFYRGTTRFYDMQDQWFRLATYLKHTREGMVPANAALEVAKYFPNYETTSAVGKFLRGETAGGVGVLAGGPFSSFPMETMRVYSQLVHEHPGRAMAISMIPLSFITVMGGLQGLTPLDYMEFHSQLPTYQRGKIWIPISSDKETGERYWWDSTQVWPLGEWFTASPALSATAGRQVPQGPLGNVLGGPSAAPLALLTNSNPQTGQKVYDPNRGDSWTDVVNYLTRSIVPLPNAALSLAERQQKSFQGVPYERWESEPESLGTSLSRAVAPQFFRHTPESWMFQQRAGQEAGARSDLERGFGSITRNPTIPEAEKERRLRNIRKSEEAVQGKRY